MSEQNNHETYVQGKKILYLITQSNYGGAQKYVLELARHFRHANTVRIAVGEATHQDHRFFEESQRMGIEPIVLKSLQREISLVKAFDALFEIRKLLAAEKPNILHINSSMAGAIGACAAWLYGFDPLNQAIRVVYTVHGFVFNEPLPLARKKMYVAIERLSTMWKSAIITVSQYDKDQGLRYRIAPEARMVVIHNGIDASQPCLSRKEARAALNLTNGLSVGTVASLYKTKGIPYLVEACAIVTQKNRSVKFIVIGDGPERRDIEERIKKLAMEKTLMLLGHKERAEQYLRAFDVFVLPSVKEGFPYALLEAGLAGVPIVASRVGGIGEIIEHEKNGLLVPPAHPQELANALLTLLGNEKLRTSYATSMSETVRKKFTVESMLQKTEDLYARLVASPLASVSRSGEKNR